MHYMVERTFKLQSALRHLLLKNDLVPVTSSQGIPGCRLVPILLSCPLSSVTKTFSAEYLNMRFKDLKPCKSPGFSWSSIKAGWGVSRGPSPLSTSLDSTLRCREGSSLPSGVTAQHSSGGQLMPVEGSGRGSRNSFKEVS